MTAGLDLATTLLLLPADARLLPVADLAPRLREALGHVRGNAIVVTRPGFRVTTRQVAPALAMLLAEFRTPSRLTDAVHRFSQSNGQDPQAMLDLSFDALVSCIGGRILVDAASADALAVEPTLAAGEAFAGMEVEALVRSLNDTELYRVRMADGRRAALKVARDGHGAAALSHEAALQAELAGPDIPALLADGVQDGRRWLALAWREGVSVTVAAQQARAGQTRKRLAGIVGAVLAAYARLHARGFVHGDIHPGNILVAEDDRVTLLDLGRAGVAGVAGAKDPARAGVPYFHDPELAEASLHGDFPPAATAQSEQHALAVLAYMLLTGLYPFEPTADNRELLARIADRPPLPFAERGAEPWPAVEAVLHRALAKRASQRFTSTAAFARAFQRASRIPRPALPHADWLEPVLDRLRVADMLPGIAPIEQAWLSYRAAISRSDAALLAAADVLVQGAGPGWTAAAVAAGIARARGDRRDEQAAIDAFAQAAGRITDFAERQQMLLAAACLLEGAPTRGLEVGRLQQAVRRSIRALQRGLNPLALHPALALGASGAFPLPANMANRLSALPAGSPWLWALAHRQFPQRGFDRRACTAYRTPDLLLRSLRHLRLYQMTGRQRFLVAARRCAASIEPGPPVFAAMLLAIELEAPSRAIPPPWLAGIGG